jgi:hypothetical protein
MAGPALRVADSLRRLTALQTEISDWTNLRCARDTCGQFATQLRSLDAALVDALGRLSQAAGRLAPGPLGATYELCRAFDDELLTVRRLWRWFADKFEQRDNNRYAPVLAAADEVAWSLYAGAMRAANGGKVPQSSPLAYLDDVNVPEAVPRDLVPSQLRPDVYTEALQVMLAKLPIPVVGLPAGIADEPWRLALLGHEVGHHLQYDLLPDQALIASIGTVVAEAAGDDVEESEWRWWSRELFADLAALVALGPASLTVLLPLELGTAQHMLDRERDPRYPAPAVRLALIAEMGACLGVRVDENFSPIAATGPVISDLARAPDVARTLVGYRVGERQTMAQLTGFSAADFRPGGAVSVRARQLTEQRGIAQRGLPMVRGLVSAGVVAWQQVGAMTDAGKRTEALRKLADALIKRIIGSAEPGTRGSPAGAAASTTAAAVGADLAAILERDLVR